MARESGAAEVHIAYRHETPAFTPSDWAWVQPSVTAMKADPSWFRRLDEKERRALIGRFWPEGRLNLEPWLAQRIEVNNIHLHPGTNLVGSEEMSVGLRMNLDSGLTVTADDVIFATGYKMDLARVPFLTDGLLANIEVHNGFPELNEHFQTSVAGLYMTSYAAAQDFGPFFGFTVSVRASARIIGEDLRQALSAASS